MLADLSRPAAAHDEIRRTPSVEGTAMRGSGGLRRWMISAGRLVTETRRSDDAASWSSERAETARYMVLIALLLTTFVLAVGLAGRTSPPAMFAFFFSVTSILWPSKLTFGKIYHFFTGCALVGAAVLSDQLSILALNVMPSANLTDFAVFVGANIAFILPVVPFIIVATACGRPEPITKSHERRARFWAEPRPERTKYLAMLFLPGALVVAALPYVVLQNSWPMIDPGCVDVKRELFPVAALLACAVGCYYGGVLLGLSRFSRELTQEAAPRASNHSPIAAPHT